MNKKKHKQQVDEVMTQRKIMKNVCQKMSYAFMFSFFVNFFYLTFTGCFIFGFCLVLVKGTTMQINHFSDVEIFALVVVCCCSYVAVCFSSI